jgi:hypothetical protein
MFLHSLLNVLVQIANKMGLQKQVTVLEILRIISGFIQEPACRMKLYTDCLSREMVQLSVRFKDQ